MSYPSSRAALAARANDVTAERLFTVAQILSLKLIHGDVITRLAPWGRR